jgi:hypothetical protein
MALQPFVGSWPLVQFLNLKTVGTTPWTGDQPITRPLPTHSTKQTQNKRAHRHQCLDWDSNTRSQLWSERKLFSGDQSCEFPTFLEITASEMS